MNEINLNTQTDQQQIWKFLLKAKFFFFGLVIKAFQVLVFF